MSTICVSGIDFVAVQALQYSGCIFDVIGMSVVLIMAANGRLP